MRRYAPFALLLFVVAGLYAAGWLERLEHRLIDLRSGIVAREASGEVVLVAIDSRSMEMLQAWPWPRGYHATAIENLIQAGARCVGLDVDLSSRSIAEEDSQLEQAFAAAGGRVVLPVFRQWEHDVENGGRWTTTRPLPEMERHVQLGTINVRPGTDGLARYYSANGSVANLDAPSFAAALAAFDGRAPDEFYIDFGIRAGSIARLSYVDVLTGQFDPAVVAGRAVLIGSTAVELGDYIVVPRLAAVPGPVVQALAFESLVQDRTLRRSGPWLTLAITVLICLVAGPWFEASGWRGGLAWLVLLSATAFGAATVVQWHTPYLLDTAPWLLSLGGIYAWALVRRIDHQAWVVVLQGRQVRRSESLMRHVVQNSFDAIITVRDERIETFNRAAEVLFGCREEDVIGRRIDKLIVAGEKTRGGEPVSVLPRDGADPCEVVGRRADGTSFPLEATVNFILVDGEHHRVAFLRDITERKAQREALRHQATHDALTELPNRYLLSERFERVLEEARREGRRVAFLLQDLDRFKEINDTLGHHTGDLLLRKIARRLQLPLRPHDTIARLGGDEFAVLLPDTEPQEAEAIARKLIRALLKPFAIDDLGLQVDTSIGISLFPEHGTSATELIQRADVAMYVAKRTRSGVAVYDSRDDRSSVRRLTLTGDLRRAIEARELNVVYQPKISAGSGNLLGVEALLRWPHPELGMIAPPEFITLAENTGLIGPLTRFVLETALWQCAEWAREGTPLDVSVNVSARDLLDEELPKILRELMLTAGVPGSRLTLEITESVIMDHPQRAFEVLGELCALGVGISIDDFGTGYSSMGYLKKLPATELKIDKSFVMEMHTNNDDAMIVRSIIDLAHNLGLKVVAEGVETQEVWQSLKDLGCDIGQGYLFSKPASPRDLSRWMRPVGAASTP